MKVSNNIFLRRIPRIERIWILIVVFVIFISYFGVNHSDLIGTCIISDLLLIGHVIDFYDYVLQFFPIKSVAYLPPTYLLFSIWNYPLMLLNNNTPYYFSEGKIDTIVGIGIYWSKLLPVLFYLLTGFIIHDILTNFINREKAKYAMIFWYLSPLSFFSQFIFGQYDIFYVFFMMLGISYFVKERYLIGSIFFGVSFTFKYFPALIFLILLVYVFKNKPLQILKHSILGLLPLTIIFLIYGDSESFRLVVFHNPASLMGFTRMLNDGISNGVAQASFFAITYFILLLSSLILLQNYNKKTHILLSVVTVSLFAIFVDWNPQWILFSSSLMALLPFAVGNVSNNFSLEKYSLLDILLMLFFTGYVAFTWPWNVDVNMLNNLPLLRGINPLTPDTSTNLAFIFSLGNRISLDLARNIYYSGFVSTWVFVLIFSFGMNFFGFTPKSAESNWLIRKSIYLRFVVGVSIFLLPSLVLLFWG